MSTRRILFMSLFTALIGIGFSVSAVSSPPQSNWGSKGYASAAAPSYTHPQHSAPYGWSHRGAVPAAGFPCTWSGSRDFARGESAYQQGNYADAVSRWQAAAGKTCAIAAYYLGVIYFYGLHGPANQPLGVAWMSVAAGSRYSRQSYESVRDAWTNSLDDAGRTRLMRTMRGFGPIWACHRCNERRKLARHRARAIRIPCVGRAVTAPSLLKRVAPPYLASPEPSPSTRAGPRTVRNP